MATKKSKKDHPGDTRKHIQDVATELFNEIGFDETSIPMICERAGVSKTTLHYYFPKKDDLYHDMANNFEDQFNGNFHRVFECDTFTKQIWEIFQIMCEGDLYYGVATTQHYFTLRLKSHSQRNFVNSTYHRKMLIPIIRSAQRAGQMLNMSDPEQISDTLSYAMRGVIITWAIENGTLDLIQSSKDMIRSIILPAEGYDF